jgi:uncharacterized protein YbaP (TraB family)
VSARHSSRKGRAAALAALLPALWLAPAMRAAEQPAPRLADGVLDQIVVTGEQPGPAMWKVSKDGHTIWIMGSLTPLPAKMSWRSKQVEAVIARSSEIMGNTSVRPRVKGGTFGMLRLIPSLLRLRNNADGATLREALPPDLYARWSAQYRRFFGKEPSPKEKWRPLTAADELYKQALEKSGLTGDSPVWPTVEKLAKRYKVHIRDRELEVPLQDPKGLIAEVAKIPRDKEVACLVLTLDYIDRELPNIKRRAAAWAVGDIETLRKLPPAVDRTDCFRSLLDALQPQLQEKVTEVRTEIDTDRTGIFSWMVLARETSFTVMPIERLLRENDLIARWRAAGFTVEEPH